jgi:hypothetical protein
MATDICPGTVRINTTYTSLTCSDTPQSRTFRIPVLRAVPALASALRNRYGTAAPGLPTRGSGGGPVPRGSCRTGPGEEVLRPAPSSSLPANLERTAASTPAPDRMHAQIEAVRRHPPGGV